MMPIEPMKPGATGLRDEAAEAGLLPASERVLDIGCGPELNSAADSAKRSLSYHAARRTRILMLAVDMVTPYRVLRCAHVCGADVYVLGNAAVKTLRLSRFCRRATVSDCIIDGKRDESLALEINSLGRELEIDMLVPADAPSIRAVIASRDLIELPCFPLPQLDSFEILNDKWSFGQLCLALGILHPQTQLFTDARVLISEIEAGALRFPIIIKPLARCASAGIVVLDGPEHKDRLCGVNYRPLLVQEFIRGEDIGSSVYASDGRIEAFVVHSLHRGVYATFRDEAIYADIEKIVRRHRLNGVYNFDMLRATDGRVYYLECNPRPFFKIDLSMLAGINFMECGIFPQRTPAAAWARSSESSVRFPKAMLRSLLTSGRCSRRDFSLAVHLLADPLPYLLEKLAVTT